MDNVMPLNTFPVSKPVGNKSSKADLGEQDKAGMDFATFLMGMLMTRPLTSDNLMGVENAAISNGAFSLEALPAINNLLIDMNPVLEGQNQTNQTPLLVDFLQVLTVDGEETQEGQVLTELGQSAQFGQAFKKGLERKLLKDLTGQGSGASLNLTNLEIKDSVSTLEQLEMKLKVHEQPNAQLATPEENLQFNQTDGLEFVAEKEEQVELGHQQTEVNSQQEFVWQPVEGQVEFSASKSVDAQPKEPVFPKQLESVMQQLVEQSKLTIDRGKSEVEIKLKPEYLGKVHLKVVLEEGILTAKLAVENHAVGKALESNLSQLKNYMKEQGLNFSQVNVEVGSGTLDQGQKESFANQQRFGNFSTKLNLEEPQEEIRVLNTGLSGVNYLA